MIPKLTKYVDASFKETFGEKHDIVAWLTNHERKPLMISNLEREIVTAMRTTHVLLGDEQIKMLCKDFSRLFAENAIQEKEQSLKKRSLTLL